MAIKLSAFCDDQCERLEARDANLLRRVAGQLQHYWTVLGVIRDRYLRLCNDYLEKNNLLGVGLAEQPPSVDSSFLSELKDLTTLLRLEIETFYLLAKILLDWLARFVEFYFGPARKLSLDSHDDLVKRIEDYASAKDLSLPDGIVVTSKQLKKDISDFRDYEVAHQKNPRVTDSYNYNSDGRIRLAYIRMYPRESDRRAETRPLDDLLRELEDYLNLIVDLAAANRDHTVLRAR